MDGGFGVVGSEPPAGVQCRSRARAVRSPSVTRLFYCFFAAAPRAVSPLVHLLARCSFLAEPVFSLRSPSWMHEIHPLSLAAGMMTCVGVERFTNTLPRAADCAARRLSIVTFTIAHLNSHMRPDSPFYSVCLSFDLPKDRIGQSNKINHYQTLIFEFSNWWLMKIMKIKIIINCKLLIIKQRDGEMRFFIIINSINYI